MYNAIRRGRMSNLAVIFLLVSSSLLAEESISIPVSISYPLFRQFVVTQLFTGQGSATELVNDSSGCNEIELSDPQLHENQRLLQIDSRVHLKLGAKVLGQCSTLVNWSGFLKVLTRPITESIDKPVIHLEIVDSQLLSNENKVLTSGAVWDFAKSRFHPLLSQFRLDLNESINPLVGFLTSVLPSHSRTQIQKIVDSLKMGRLRIEKDGLKTSFSIRVPLIGKERSVEKRLSEEELLQFQDRWQSMDALLTFAIKLFGGLTGLPELREALFEVLIDARYGLRAALTENRPNDPVRTWFIESWRRLSPLLIKVSDANPSASSLALVTLISSTDALRALDNLGPSVGLEISVDGLRRLARLLNKSPDVDPLRYDPGLDPELRRLFLLQSDPGQLSEFTITFWPIQSVIAANRSEALTGWIPKRHDLDAYLRQVRQLLRKTTDQSVEKAEITQPQLEVFKLLVLATAWQESCWRQYIVNRRKIIPLRSRTGDTGIMQVNEKVWRGFFDPQKLRWDIAYNARAGTDVLLNYYTRYAIKKAEHKRGGGMDNLARAAYSAYNGGPRQLSRYRNNEAPAALRKVDQAFHQKFFSVKQGNDLSVAKCLGFSADQTRSGGSEPGLMPVANKGSISGHQGKAARSGHNQNPNYYTLQLGVFSTKQAAVKFISDQSNADSFFIYEIRKQGKKLFGVSYGSYKFRTEAENAAARFKKLNPWMRRFQDIPKKISP